MDTRRIAQTVFGGPGTLHNKRSLQERLPRPSRTEPPSREWRVTAAAAAPVFSSYEFFFRRDAAQQILRYRKAWTCRLLNRLRVNSMAAPHGNHNARKGRLFEQALTREIKQRDLKDGDGETLRKIASQLVEKAIAGDPYATRDIRDTLDGRPAQTIQGPDGESVFGPMVGAAEELRKKLK